MKAKRFLGIALSFSLFTFTSTVLAAGLQVLHGHMPAELSALKPLGTLPETNHLNLAISLPWRNQAQLTKLLSDIYNPASPSYHHYLTPAQFAENFGPSDQDYQAVITFAKANHLQVTGTYPNRSVVDVNGSVADIQRALHVTMNRYNHPRENRTFFAPNGEPSLNLSVPVLHISGLDNYELPRPRLVATPITAQPNATPAVQSNASPNSGSGPGGAYRGLDFRNAYVPNVKLDGTGQQVGLLEFDGYAASDINYYEQKAGLPNVPLQNVLVDHAGSGPTSPGNADIEVTLDIEVALSLGTNLSAVVVYIAPNGAPFEDVLNQMVASPQIKQFSCSWYISGGTEQPAADNIWLQMAAQGQSFFNASGDDDAWSGLIYFPGDSPYITQVGGTTLSTTGPGGAWLSETVWNRGNGIGSGGGISTQYPIPSWQTNISMVANQGSTTMRNTPDVAMTAENAYVRADGSDYNVGGTSCAAPLWAGFASLINQEAIASGKSPIGFINPAIDTIGKGASYTLAFHDITTGSNTRSGSPSKFYAVSGYDLCTGWGTPAGQRLIDALANPEPLVITPANGFVSVGGVGGPFTVTSGELTLTNAGTNSLTWSLANTSQWLSVSSAGGILPSHSPAVQVTVSLNNDASNLALGTYTASLLFTNVSDNFGQSRQYTLTLIPPPAITVQPTNQAVLGNATATFSASAAGGLPQSYQWQFDGTNLTDGATISGSATTNLIINDVSQANVGLYNLVVSNIAGSVVSSNAALTIIPSPPVIAVQPTNETVFVGQTAVFNVTAYGNTPLVYQWSFDGTNIDGATNSSLALPDVQLSQSGTYAVVITNNLGSILSSNATLTALPVTLVGYWPFNEGSGTVLHDIINSNNGTIYNGTWGSGISGSDLGFNGSSTYVGIPSLANLNFNTNPFSISLWFNGNTDDTYPAILSNNPGGWSTGSFALRYGNQGNNVFSVHWYPTDYILESGTLNPNTWHHAVFIRNSTNISLYIDAALTQTAIVSAASPINLGSGGTMLLGGNTWDAGNSYYLGSMEQLRIYQGPLPPEQITNLYTVIAPPAITTQPQSQAIVAGNPVTFNVVASSSNPPGYQWQFNGTNISGATSASYTIPSTALTDAGNYTVIVSNLLGSTISSTAVLTVYAATPPTISTQPTNQTVVVGGTASFSVMSGGAPPLIYQWTFDGTNILGATNMILTLTNVQLSQAGNYAVVITNTLGSTLSSNALLTVYGIPPTITAQPANQTASLDATASFSVTAGGTSPLSFQWSFNATNIPGATNATLTLTNVQVSQGGVYAVLVTNNFGSILSSNATLTVLPAVLIGYWPFNEGAGTVLHDIINSNNGTIYNGTWGSGISGSDLGFNGSSTYVGIPSLSNLNFNTNPFSISLWFNGNTDDTYPAILSNNPGGWESGSFALRYGNQGNNAFSVHWYPTDYVLESGTLNPNTWHHAVFIRNSTNISLYIDAVLTQAATVSAASPINLGSGGTMLLGGNTWDGGNSYYLGSMEQLRIYQGALSPQQITNLYTVIAPPAITTQPQSQSVLAGSSVTFNVMASSPVSPSYQWQFNGVNISGATSASYSIPSTALTNAGNYDVVVANALGSITSSNAVLTVIPVQSCDPAPTNIVAWWPGEDNTWDVVGTNNGTANGNLTYTNGEVGQAFVFDGSSSYISVPASPSLNLGAGVGLTVECWVNPSAVNAANGGAPVIEWDSDNTDGADFWVDGDGSLFMNIKDTSDNSHEITTATGIVPTNTWTHIAFTYDESSGNAYIYTNGSVAGSNNFGSFTPQTTYPVNIGRRTGEPIGNGDTYAGMIDEMSLYNRALSSSEIAAIYNAGSNGKCPPPPTPPSITAQPTNETVVVGNTAIFSAVATGTPPLYYQWIFAGTNVVGATNATLILNNVQFNQAGTYALMVSNQSGSITSSNATLAVVPPPPCDPAPANIVTWWPGEDNTGDVVGTNNGTANGNLTYTNGEVGQAFVFDGSSSYISVPASPSLNLGAGGGLTIECWVNPSAVNVANGGAPVIEWDSDNTDGADFWVDGDGSLFMNIKDTSDNSHEITTATGIVLTNTWTHIAFTYDESSGNAYIYTNGGMAGFNNFGSFTPQTTYPVNIGRRTGQPIGNGDTYAGMIDEMSLYNRALSSSEIAAIYNAGSGGKCPPVLPFITAQPTNQTVSAATSAVFSVQAGGPAPFSFQWLFNGTNAIAGSTNSTLILTNVQYANQGLYSVIVSNPFGSVTSSNALLIVTVDHFAWNIIPSPRFLNAPFAVKVTAQDAANGVFSNYVGVIFLGATNGLPIAPTVASNLVQGVWAGTIAVSQTASNLVLSASDGSGHMGLSNPINIVTRPTLTTTPSSGTLYLSWPIAPSGFVLMTTTNIGSGIWTPVAGTPLQFGGLYLEPIIVNQTNPGAFYRLQFNGP